MARRAEITLDTVHPQQPLRLADACRLFFADVLTPAALRMEAARGNLDMMRIAGKDFVTPAAIEDMKQKCRVAKSHPTSSSGLIRPSKAETENLAASGSSKTEVGISAQDALNMKLERLSKGSANTSAKSTTRSRGTGALLRFPSQTS